MEPGQQAANPESESGLGDLEGDIKVTLGYGPVIDQAMWEEGLQQGLERNRDDFQGQRKALRVRTRACFPGRSHRQQEGMQASVSQTEVVR